MTGTQGQITHPFSSDQIISQNNPTSPERQIYLTKISFSDKCATFHLSTQIIVPRGNGSLKFTALTRLTQDQSFGI